MDIWLEQALSIATGAPSPEGWRQLCAQLERMGADPPAEQLDLLQDALSHWPDDLRATMCGAQWDDVLLEGRDDPRLTVFRTFRFNAYHLGRYGGLMIRNPRLRASHVQAMASTPATRHFTCVDLSMQDCLADQIGTLRLAAFERLIDLKLSNCSLGDESAVDLAACPWTARLEKLRVGSNKIELRGLKALLAALPRCRVLALSGNPLGDAGAHAIAAASLPELRELELADCGVSADGLAALGSSGLALDKLALSKNRLVALDALAQLPLQSLQVNGASLAGASFPSLQATRLCSLDVSDNALDDAAILALAQALPATLERLNLRENTFGSAGLQALLRCPSLRALDLGRWDAPKPTDPPLADWSALAGPELASGLTTLWCCRIPLGQLFSALLARCPELAQLTASHAALETGSVQSLLSLAPSLVSLDLGGNPIGAEGVERLAQVRWEKLESLRLSASGAGDRGLQALSEGSFPCLNSLDLSENAIGDEGIVALAASPVCAKLERLYLRHNQLTTRAITALLSSPHLSRLQVLGVDNNGIDEQGMRALAAWNGPLYISGHSNPGDRADIRLPVNCCP